MVTIFEFDTRSGHVGFTVKNVAVGLVFSEHMFPLLILIPPTAPYSLIVLSSNLYSLDTDSVVK
jgi:hypothetical protein